MSIVEAHQDMFVNTLWLVTIPRLALGLIFSSAALSYFWMTVFGWPLLPLQVSEQGMEFALGIIRIGYLWPLMKFINLCAGILLLANRVPAFALALLAPITVVIVWFQILLNPLPIPLATILVVTVCELLLFRAYAPCYTGLFRNIVSR